MPQLIVDFTSRFEHIWYFVNCPTKACSWVPGIRFTKVSVAGSYPEGSAIPKMSWPSTHLQNTHQ